MNGENEKMKEEDDTIKAHKVPNDDLYPTGNPTAGKRFAKPDTVNSIVDYKRAK